MNVYQYRATISGLPIRDLLVLLIILCFSLLIARFSIIASAFTASFSLLAFLLFIRSRDNSPVSARFLASGRERAEKLEASFHKLNGHLFTAAGNNLSIIFQVATLDFLAMREDRQEVIRSGLTDALNHVRERIDFLSFHNGETRGSGFQNPISHTSFIRLTIDIEDGNTGAAADSLVSASTEIAQYFHNAGFPFSEIVTRDEMARFLLHSAGISKERAELTHILEEDRFHKRIGFRQYRNFARTDDYISDIVVRNASYSSGPFYQAILESMNIPFDIIFSLRGVDSGNQLQFVNRLIAERRTEYRFSRGMSRETDYLKQQVSDLERIKENIEKHGCRLFDATMTIRIYADHPAILNARVQRAQSSFGMLGFQTAHSAKHSLKKMRDFSLNLTRPKYLMDTGSIAGILPIFRARQDDEGGIILGIDDLSEKIVEYNPFLQNSYNSLIIGETGSGKSYFAKMFIKRALTSGLSQKAIIFDPLYEYNCKLFDSTCREYTIRSYSEIISGNSLIEQDTPSNSLNVDVKIIRPEFEEMESDEAIGEMLIAINREMSGNKGYGMLIAIDECHIILRNSKNAKSLGTMVRHSRHYRASIMNISQNTDDFLSRISSNIAYNSNRIFIFRTRNISESHKKVLKIDGFDIPAPENLAGGTSHQYSECIVSDGTYCRTIRIITSKDEDKVLKSSV